MKRYQHYKESGIPWLGEVPQHWEVLRAKSMFNRMSRSVREEDEVITCFRDGEVTLRKNRRLEGFTESLKEIGYQGIRKGDLVIHQMDAFAGAIGVSDSDGKATPVYICLQPKDGYYNPYYAYLLREMARSGYIKALYRGIRQRSSDFRFETFAPLLLPAPPMEEQRAIAEYLDRETAQIDAIVEQLTALRERYDQLKRSLISEVITQGLPHHNPSTFRSLRLKDICHINRESLGERSDNIEFEYISIGDVDGNGVINNKERLSFGSAPSRARRIVREGDVIVSTVRTYLEAIALIDSVDFPTIVSTGFAVLSPFEKTVISKYLYYKTKSSYSINWIVANSLGISYPAITSSTLSALPISLPSLEEQEEIVAYLDEHCGRIDRLSEAIGRKIELLGSLKKSLIEEVVTGQRSVIEH